MIYILSDSCSDLGPELLQRFGVETIPFPVSIGEETFLDGVTISTSELLAKTAQSNKLPKTAAPAIGQYINFFSRPGPVIFTGIGSKLSAGMHNALLARQELPDREIHIVDSHNLSSGIGLTVLLAAEMRNQGATPEEIIHAMEAQAPRVRTSFVIDTLDFLYMGGRCSAMQHLFGSLLKIRPVVAVNEGALIIRDKIRGSRKKALDSMLADFDAHLSHVNLRRLFITHTGCHEDAQYLADELRKRAAIDDLCITIAGSTIASHCGPNTIGILYVTR